MIRVLTVDDQEVVRIGVQHLLEDVAGMQIVAVASTPEEALFLVPKCKPDIVVMEINLSGIGGIELARKLRYKHPRVKLTVFTELQSELYPPRLLKIGVLGYVSKYCPNSELIQAVRSAYNKKRYLSPLIASQLALMHTGSGKDSPFALLPKREFQVALMIMRGLDPDDIADKLCLSSKTVNSYRYAIFSKLGVTNDVGLVLLALQHGLIEDVQMMNQTG